MNPAQGHLLGVDVGTSGVRVVATNERGHVAAESRESLSPTLRTDTIHEQDPQDWWSAVCRCVRRVTDELRSSTDKIECLGIAVASTSGTLVLADHRGEPVRPAILYDDTRAGAMGAKTHAGTRKIHSSFSIVKADWVRRSEPAVWERARYITHPTGWLTGRLTGEFGLSDWSNALKLGYDAEGENWSPLVGFAELPPDRLPTVCRPGTRIGGLTRAAARQTGLPEGVAVMAGCTDGIASFLACGAHRAGHSSTTLGTTLVWKVLADVKPASDGKIYCHRHPSGRWIPGAASNTGLGSVEPIGGAASDQDRRAQPHLPARILCYRLPGRGERFPFRQEDAVAFCEGKPASAEEWYAAQLQSIAFVERWGYEVLIEAGIPLGDIVLSAGGGASSPVLAQLRASVMNRRVVRTEHPVAAFGAAILAATGSCYSGDIEAALASMTKRAEEYHPQAALRSEFEALYCSFRELCARKGYG